MKILKLILIVTLSIFLVSCGSKTDSSLSKNFKQGVGGISVGLMENNPPKEVYPNSNFKLILSIENSAAYNVNDGFLRIIGFDEDYFEVYPLEERFETLNGKSYSNPDGDKIFFEFDGEAKSLFQNSEKYVADYFIETNYKSTMKFADTVCINSELYGSIGAGCKVQTKKSYSGQGAAFAITNLEEIISPGLDSKVEFRFKLKNKGNGELISVNLNNAKLGKEGLDCRFQDLSSDKKRIDFTYKNQETTLVCIKSLKENEAYFTTLMLDFDYVYELSSKHRLTIIK